jgi:ATP-dependent Clp protease ATP-binding subunit ClpA
MKTKMMFVLSLAIALVLCNGCSSEQAKTGFLSDYSKLQKESDSSMRYINDKMLPKYSAFVIDPVKAVIQPEKKTERKLTDQQITDLTSYMNTKIREAVQAAGKKIAYQPAAGVARIRVALTDLEKTGAINMLPQASLLGAGIGGASMEAEVVDSMTGQQVGAVVESAKGGRIPFTNLGDWTAAKSVMDGWAERFQKRLEGAK